MNGLLGNLVNRKKLGNNFITEDVARLLWPIQINHNTAVAVTPAGGGRAWGGAAPSEGTTGMEYWYEHLCKYEYSE